MKLDPKPPRHLAKPTRAWWASIVATFELEDHHLRLLEAACDAWDRMAEARTVLNRDGLTVADRYGVPKMHPLVPVERDSRLAFARIVRELRLDDAPAPDARPPRGRVR